MRRLVACLASLAAVLVFAAAVSGGGGTPTYADVAPIFNSKCAGCHVQGGIAPFTLTSARDAQAHARAILRTTRARAMPPWPPARDSKPFVGEDARRLTARELDLVARWVRAGAPAGRPVAAPRRPAAPAGLVVGARTPYVPHAKVGLDDYHCTLLDPKLQRDRWVTAARVLPGRTDIVHHVILYQVRGPAADFARARDRAAGGKGWTCFGGAGLDGDPDHSYWLGVWAPGKTNDGFPAGTAMLLPRGSAIVLQTHYNLIHAAKPDRTRVALRFAPLGAQPKALETKLYPAPIEVPCPPGATGRLCSRSAAIDELRRVYGHNAAATPDVLLRVCGKTLATATGSTTSCERRLGEATTIYGVMGHMHMRGVDIRVELNPGRPGATLLHIPAWDFQWQDMYTLKAPVEAPAGSVVRVTCTFDNSPGKQPHVRTGRLAPRYVLWGEGTTDEMCLGVLQAGAAG